MFISDPNTLFIGSFYVLSVICLGLYFATSTSSKAQSNAVFRKFQLIYLFVYGLAVAGDWLQGPHIYALYESYGLEKHQIEFLFVCGFSSSLIFGTFIGSLADKLGRKFNCILYGMLYCLCCFAANFNNFYILIAGRFLGGIATSILFSAFESWAVSEHNSHGFSTDELGILFSHAALTNSLVAVISGVSAHYAADHFGYIAPFNLAIIILIIMIIITFILWNENKGDEKTPFKDSFSKAAATIKRNVNVLCLGLVQSLFEGAMFIFVLCWTPALSLAYGSKDLPHGYIFSSFMVAIMIGSSVFKLLSKYIRPESFMRFILLVAAASMSIFVIFPPHTATVFGSFIIFEISLSNYIKQIYFYGCIGIFWPAMGWMRGIYVPEDARSTIINLFRIPLNLIVIGVILLSFEMQTNFCICVGLLLLATVTQMVLNSRTSNGEYRAGLPMTVITADEVDSGEAVDSEVNAK